MTGSDATHHVITGPDVLAFDEVDRTMAAIVGGKGAHLGELARIDGIDVPPGFCVSTDAYRRVVTSTPSIEALLDELSGLRPDDAAAIPTASARVRDAIEAIVVPDVLAEAIGTALDEIGASDAYAVRSSATAEDLPTASFAGQQDTYLNVVGPAAVIEHVRRCWASLFTERAVTYRLRNGFDHREVSMAVVVQRMVFPHVAGILFTADPITSNRKVAVVEASFGLGEALVSGLVNADSYRVRDAAVVATTIATKERGIFASPHGGTHERAIEAAQQDQPALTDAQAVHLVELGRRIEAHLGDPQDIEWCLTDDGFRIVQSRPITTLFPIPEQTDEGNHVYLSVGHQQMMTDAMKPLGLSIWQLTTPRPMAEAGGRLFVDVTPVLASPASRPGFLAMIGKADPLILDALQTVLDRDDFIAALPDEHPGAPAAAHPPPWAERDMIDADPTVVTELIDENESSVAAMAKEIRTKSGPALFDFIRADIAELQRLLFAPRSTEVFMTAMDAAWWLNEHLEEWLGEKNAADVLTQSVPHNVTSEMGLALLDVADAVRPHPEVIAVLQAVEEAGPDADDGFLDALRTVDGGQDAVDAIRAYLDRYGMRCVGEIDITRTRWSERPALLVPMILSNVENFAPGAGERRFEAGRREAEQREQELLVRLRALPDGEAKAAETKRMIDRVRTFIGYREYPKYGKVSREFVYKQALLAEAERLVRAGVLRAPEDIELLRFDELHEVARTNHVDHELIRRRRDAFRSYQALTPPRVLTSDGEGISGSYRRDDVPAGALVGLPVSAGIVEGRARVILDVADAELEPGDILVTAYTDPSWSPLFVAIAGIVTEVGGAMTHGAVIAREYGLPAVVGVERATRLIEDGQRIRVNGTDGYVEVLPIA